MAVALPALMAWMLIWSWVGCQILVGRLLRHGDIHCLPWSPGCLLRIGCNKTLLLCGPHQGLLDVCVIIDLVHCGCGCVWHGLALQVVYLWSLDATKLLHEGLLDVQVIFDWFPVVVAVSVMS